MSRYLPDRDSCDFEEAAAHARHQRQALQRRCPECGVRGSHVPRCPEAIGEPEQETSDAS
jgi:hypothetical protein